MHSSETSSKSWFVLPRLLPRTRRFSAQEVLTRLQVDPHEDPRTEAVHQAASRTSAWSSHLPERDAFDLGRTASRLPTIVFWYAQGMSLHEIGQRLSFFGSAWDAERALDVAAGLIAQALNSGQLLP